MPAYALLGATGSTGSAILRCLLSQPPKHLTLNIFVRSRSKLRKAFPELESTTAFKTNIIEGIPSDYTATQECLKDVDVVMACIGSNYSTKGISLISDTATAIIDALEAHRKTQGSAYKPPTIIQLRTASLNPIYKAALPWLAQKVAPFCFYYIYEDLDRACKLLASSIADSPGLLDYIFIDPPSIHDAHGTTPTGYKLILDEKQDSALSYADLGAAFCEVAKRRDEFVGKAVGVTATGTVNQTWGILVGYMATGAKGRIWG
jgi:oxidoreductase AflX